MVRLISTVAHSVSPMAPKGMDGSSTSHDFTTVRYAARDEVFFPGFHWNPLSVDDQGVATLHDYQIFVVIVDMFRRARGFSACPKCHLAPLDPIEHVTLDPWRGLMGSGNPVGGIFHEWRKVVHVASHCRTLARTAPVPYRRSTSRRCFRSVPRQAAPVIPRTDSGEKSELDDLCLAWVDLR
jgi:hypothetical protein